MAKAGLPESQSPVVEPHTRCYNALIAAPQERIVLATIQSIEQYGVSRATVRRSADVAGVNVAAINYYFGSKDRLLEAGYSPDVVVGDMDSVSDKALRSGAEIVVHAYAGGRAPGRERVDRLGLPSALLPAPGMSEDVAILLAYEKGAELIVAVGTRFNLTEFLERDRAGMSSTFLTRLKVGDILVDARGVSRLFRARAGVGPLLAFVGAGLGAIVAAVAVSSDLQRFLSLVVERAQSVLGL